MGTAAAKDERGADLFVRFGGSAAEAAAVQKENAISVIRRMGAERLGR
jgi:hypothetical protein